MNYKNRKIMLEQWRTAIVDGETWENYQVSNLGQILSLDYNRTGRAELMKPEEDKFGYFRVTLCKNKETKHCFVHRLVAEAFLPNPEEKPCVNHKIEGDEGKKMNIVYLNKDGSVDKKRSTIEWATYEENINYGGHNQRSAKTRSKTVLQLSLTGELIREWESTQECGRNGFNHSCVIQCCNGKQKTHKGYIFKYK